MGYKGDLGTLRQPHVFVSKSGRKAKELSRVRHETNNRRMKQFCILSSTYRHDVDKHRMIFRAVAVLTQIYFDCGGPPFLCRY